MTILFLAVAYIFLLSGAYWIAGVLAYMALIMYLITDNNSNNHHPWRDDQ